MQRTSNLFWKMKDSRVNTAIVEAVGISLSKSFEENQTHKLTYLESLNYFVLGVKKLSGVVELYGFLPWNFAELPPPLLNVFVSLKPHHVDLVKPEPVKK